MIWCLQSSGPHVGAATRNKLRARTHAAASQTFVKCYNWLQSVKGVERARSPHTTHGARPPLKTSSSTAHRMCTYARFAGVCMLPGRERPVNTT